MKHEQELKIQALLDAELPPEETSQIAAWIESDPSARALYHELSATKSLISGNESEHLVPDSREFYWSGIERQIRQQTPAPNRSSSHAWWLRLLAPATAAALLVLVVVTFRNSPGEDEAFAAQEIESTLEGVRTFSFHAPEAGMTVVWVQDRFNW
jgi:anti-sigma factor RsiW